jgi:hypothetical protein
VRPWKKIRPRAKAAGAREKIRRTQGLEHSTENSTNSWKNSCQLNHSIVSLMPLHFLARAFDTKMERTQIVMNIYIMRHATERMK